MSALTKALSKIPGRYIFGRQYRRVVSPDAAGFASNLALGAGWIFIGTIGSQVCTLSASILNARLLKQTGYGELAIVQNTLNMLAGIGAAGLGITSTRYLARLKDSDPARAGRILGVTSSVSALTATFFAITLFLIAPLLAARSLNAPTLSGVLRVSAVAVFFVSMTAFQNGSLIGLRAFRTTAILSSAQGFVSLVLTLALVPHWGLNGAVGAIVLTSAGVWLFSQIKLRAECKKYQIRITYGNMWNERSVFFSFAVPAALSGITGEIAVWASSALVARQSDGMAQLGSFAVANTFRQVVLFAPGVLGRVATPLLASLTHAVKSRSYASSFNLNVWISGVTAGGAAAVVCLSAPELLQIYGRTYAGALVSTWLLVSTAALEAIAAALAQALIAHGRIWRQYSFATVWSIIIVVGTYFFVPRYGAVGLSLGYFGAALFYLGAYGIAARHLNGKMESSAPSGSPLETVFDAEAVPVKQN